MIQTQSYMGFHAPRLYRMGGGGGGGGGGVACKFVVCKHSYNIIYPGPAQCWGIISQSCRDYIGVWADQTRVTTCSTSSRGFYRDKHNNYPFSSMLGDYYTVASDSMNHMQHFFLRDKHNNYPFSYICSMLGDYYT